MATSTKTKPSFNNRLRQDGARQAARTVATLDLDKLLQVPTAVGPGARKGASKEIEYIDISLIQADPLQPRKDFTGLDDLVESITVHGVLQPVLVTPIPTWDKTRPQVHTIIFGERRWRAAQAAGLEFVPGVVRDLNPEAIIVLQITENVQRKELDALEFAAACTRLIKDHGYTYTKLKEQIGRSVGYIHTAVKVANDPVLALALEKKNITYSQALEMVALQKSNKMQLVSEVAAARAEGKETTQRQVRARARELQPANPNAIVGQQLRRQSSKPALDPYRPKVMEPISSRIRQGLVHVKLAVDYAAGGQVSPGEMAAADEVMEELRRELARYDEIRAGKAKRKSA